MIEQGQVSELAFVASVRCWQLASAISVRTLVGRVKLEPEPVLEKAIPMTSGQFFVLGEAAILYKPEAGIKSPTNT